MVLAGGKSTRMGVNKALLVVEGRPLIAWVVAALRRVFPEVIIAGDAELFAGYADRVVRDIFPDAGPLGGIHAGLSWARHEVVFVAACDLPFADGEVAAFIVRQIEGFDAAVPCVRGRVEPLFAAYRKSCLGPVTQALERGERRVTGFFPAVRVRYLTEADFAWRPGIERVFFNVNTPADLARLQEGGAGQVGVAEAPPRFLGAGTFQVPVVGVVGPSQAGKTTLIVGLVGFLEQAGYRVAVLKHTRHPVADTPGKDTDRFIRAGARKVGLLGPGGFLYFQSRGEPSLAAALELLGREVDIVLVEGYREAPVPQILVLGWEGEGEISTRTVAVVTRGSRRWPVPTFHPEDLRGLTAFLIDCFLSREGGLA